MVIIILLLLFFVFKNANDTKENVLNNINSFKNNKILLCDINKISYMVSKTNNWKLDIKRKSFYNNIYSIDARFCEKE